MHAGILLLLLCCSRELPPSRSAREPFCHPVGWGEPGPRETRIRLLVPTPNSEEITANIRRVLEGVRVEECGRLGEPSGHNADAYVGIDATGAVLTFELDHPYKHTPVADCIEERFRALHFPAIPNTPERNGRETIFIRANVVVKGPLEQGPNTATPPDCGRMSTELGARINYEQCGVPADETRIHIEVRPSGRVFVDPLYAQSDEQLAAAAREAGPVWGKRLLSKACVLRQLVNVRVNEFRGAPVVVEIFPRR